MTSLVYERSGPEDAKRTVSFPSDRSRTTRAGRFLKSAVKSPVPGWAAGVSEDICKLPAHELRVQVERLYVSQRFDVGGVQRLSWVVLGH